MPLQFGATSSRTPRGATLSRHGIPITIPQFLNDNIFGLCFFFPLADLFLEHLVHLVILVRIVVLVLELGGLQLDLVHCGLEHHGLQAIVLGF